MAYHHTTHTLTTSTDPVPLFWQRWLPEGEVQRVLVFQHGIGEHSGRYQPLIDAFAETGTAFYAADARGHGRTEGPRGSVTRFELFASDLSDLIQIAQSEHQSQQVFLLGHSMGGAIVLDYALRSDHQENLRGLILSSPAIEVTNRFSNRVLKGAASVLTRVTPGAVLDTMLGLADLSRHPDTRASYRSDPLVHRKASVLMGHTLFQLHRRFYAEASRLTIPVYLFHGTADRITAPEGSQRLFERLTTDDKTLNLYEGLYHETMNELPEDRQRVLDDLVEWVTAR